MSDLLIPLTYIFFLQSHTSVLALASAKHHTHALSLKIVQSALLSPHTPEGHLQHPSLLWLVRQLLLA